MSPMVPGRPDDDALSAELLRLELALALRDPEGIDGGLEALLDPEFEEVGASGRRWDRSSVLDLLGVPPEGTLAIEHFRILRPGHDVALAVYDTVAGRPGAAPERVHRSSVWVRRRRRWSLRYHQGTRSAAA